MAKISARNCSPIHAWQVAIDPEPHDGTDWKVLDSDTNQVIWTTATLEQWWASQATDEGHILVDADGRVVQPGTWEAQQPGVRKVYVA